MPKVSLGGNKRKKGKKGSGLARELLFREYEQEYAQVTKMLGECRFECYCFDGVQRLGHIRGKLRHKVWFSVGDIILVALREYQDRKCDGFHKYNPDEVKRLRELGEIPDSVKIYLKAMGDDDNESVVFEYGKDDVKFDSSEEDEEEDSDDDDDNDNIFEENDETIQKKTHSLKQQEEMLESELMDKMRKITMKGGIQLDELKRKDSLDDI